MIQTSAMDCGPAALKCLLAGFGVDVSYGRLREACQTSVDGTSIDTLETLAQSLGLEAEQNLMPVDHLLLEESEALPAIVVTRLPTGFTHFVVVWRVHGPFVQVMDPARGRRWVRREAFLRDVYVHSLSLPAETFADWARGEDFRAALLRRLRALGIADGAELADRALAAAGWAPIAALDEAVRTVAALVEAGAVSPGEEARRLVDALAVGVEASAEPKRASVYATAAPAPAASDGSEQVTVRGAVLIRVGGARPLEPEERAALPAELQAAVDEPRARPAAELIRLLAEDGLLRWGTLAAGVALAAVATVVEAVLFRGLLDPRPRRALFGAVLLLLAATAAFELPVTLALRRAGARLEERLRRLFLRKIPRLPDRYFQTRPMSDMAERAHRLHRLRLLPTLAGDIARLTIEIVVVGAALVWLHPRSAPLALTLAIAMLALPFVAEPVVAERDLRMRNHAGALARFYLDGLLGLSAVRTHGAEAALAREHRDRLGEWVRAARAALGAALAAETTSALVGFGLATWLVIGFFARDSGAEPSPGTALLVVFWALSLPALGYDLALLVQQLPAQRNLTLRLVEPLGAPDDDTGAPSDGDGPARVESQASGQAAAGTRIELDGVDVVAAGHQILNVGALTIGAGEQVAVVGASGAGKSTLLGLLLGWHRPASGTVTVDGVPLVGGAALEALRRRTVWVDPTVYLWNRPLAANLAFGLGEPAADLDGAIREADLAEVVRRLPRGAETPLGEAGALVSGGEGQRVRFGRGVLRPRPALVLLDEPFRGLDRERRRELLARARRRWKGATLLCVTHDILETEAFPRVLVVDGGRIVEDGPPAALLANPGSRYATLAEAERRVRSAAWSSESWRRLRLANGRIVEGAS